jgi:phage gpG-like protein
MKLYAFALRSPEDVKAALRTHCEPVVGFRTTRKKRGTVSYWLRFDFSSSKLDGWREELQAKASRLHEVLFAKVQALTLQLQTKVTAKLSGEVLKVRTGVLRGSVNSETVTDGATIRGTVSSSGGPAHYGVYHEKGIPHSWEIVATKSRVLAWQTSVKRNAEMAFARHVTHSALPARPYMSTTLAESEQEIREALAAEVAQVLLGKK